ncbi:gustatory receptor 68a-like [Diachasma alloeum]|uniref:Gustatory receptor n=1 Tax=Diachasma alloeum TaxID=454923 RepID=A0A4E0RTB2_9HYME|nr:gustatory receptor 68a-like [Diachasma alloeum]THK33217.1 gustatory receptor 29 [Diachasma alloeum]
MKNMQINVIIFKVLRVISLLLGLAPCKLFTEAIPSKKFRYAFKLSYSRLGCVYNISWIIIFSGVIIAIVPKVAKDYDINYSKIIITIDLTMSAMGNAFVIILTGIYCIYQKQIVEIGNRLSEVDEQFQADLFVFNKETFRNLHYSVVTMTFIIMWIISFVICLVGWRFFIFFSIILPAAVLSCLLLQYSLIINILKERFRCLNEGLSAAVKYTIESPGVSSLERNITNNRSVIDNFALIRNMRHSVYKIACDVADFYSFPVLLVIFNFCCNSITSIYFIIINALHRKNSGCPDSMSDCFWIMMYSYPIVVLSESVKRFNKEVSKTTNVIYDIRQTNFVNKEILNDFALELLHTKVAFTAFGFFSLDCTLLHSIFGMVVTYLIILLQFQPADAATE